MVSDWASSALCGSSTTITSPPWPVVAALVEVAIRYPDLLFSKNVLTFWSPVSVNLSPQFSLNQGDSIRRRHFNESRTESEPEYDANSQRQAGLVIHTHTGHMTATCIDFMCRGGILISRLRISPRVMAIRCSEITSKCQLPMYGVPGSMIPQACFVNSISECSACRFSFSLRTASSNIMGEAITQ